MASAARISDLWRRYGRAVLLAGVVLECAVFATRFVNEVQRLLFARIPYAMADGPIDLQIYVKFIRQWFEGIPIYLEERAAVHPPALFLLLWPIFGWLSEMPTRWFYAATTLVVLVGFLWLMLREARPATALDGVLLGGLILVGYPTTITIGNGQVTLYILFALLAGVLVALRGTPGVRRDLLAAALLLFALAKPNIVVPFLWILVWRGSTRPVLLALGGYFLATVAAVALHGLGLDGLRDLIAQFSHRTGRGLSSSGYGNLHTWLGTLGLQSWIFPASAIALALHGVWTYRHREAELWTLLGVTAVVARIWMYHRLYDDLLLAFTIIALYRIARDESVGSERRVLAGVLIGLQSLVFLAPVTPLMTYGQWGIVALWLAQLAFLGDHARRVTSRTAVLSAA